MSRIKDLIKSFGKQNEVKHRTQEVISRKQEVFNKWSEKFGDFPKPSFLEVGDYYNFTNLEFVAPWIRPDSTTNKAVPDAKFMHDARFRIEQIEGKIFIKENRNGVEQVKEIFPGQFIKGNKACYIYDRNGHFYKADDAGGIIETNTLAFQKYKEVKSLRINKSEYILKWHEIYGGLPFPNCFINAPFMIRTDMIEPLFGDKFKGVDLLNMPASQFCVIYHKDKYRMVVKDDQNNVFLVEIGSGMSREYIQELGYDYYKSENAISKKYALGEEIEKYGSIF